MRLRVKIVERGNPADYRRQRRWNRRRAAVCQMQFTVDLVPVNICMEGGAHCSHIAGETNHIGGRRDLLDGEAVGFKPGLHRGNVVWPSAKADTVLGWQEPLAVERCARHTGGFHIAVKRSLLFCASAEYQQQSTGRVRVGDLASVELRLSKRVEAASQSNPGSIVDWLNDARALRMKLR